MGGRNEGPKLALAFFGILVIALVATFAGMSGNEVVAGLGCAVLGLGIVLGRNGFAEVWRDYNIAATRRSEPSEAAYKVGQVVFGLAGLFIVIGSLIAVVNPL